GARVPAAVVLLSGGLDSTTALAIARSRGFDCHALTVRYGQLHEVEIDASRRVAAALGAVEHRVIALDLGPLARSAIIRAGLALGVDYAITHSCYDPEGGAACGRCDACLLRRKGFADAAVVDPTRYA